MKILSRWTSLTLLDLPGETLCGSDLSGANLGEADLRGANLRGANLRGANLGKASLNGADLSGAYLSWADLREADLSGANLNRADLRGANLRGTMLDPTRPIIRQVTDIDLAGCELLANDIVIGWRTQQSRHVGSQVYAPGRYTAPVFSVCPDTACHPGLYFGSRATIEDRYPDCPLVRVRVLRSDIVVAGGKLRCRAFEVLPSCA